MDAEELIFFDDEELDIIDEDRLEAYRRLVKIVGEIPDRYDIFPFTEDESGSSSVNFLRFSTVSRPVVKLWVYHLLNEEFNAPSTVVPKVDKAVDFLDFTASRYGVLDIRKIKELHFEDYVQEMKRRACEWEHLPRTAFKNALMVKSLLTFLKEKSYADYDYLDQYEIGELLPAEKPEFYFENEADLAEFFSREKQKEEERPIPYSDLIKIMLALKECDDVVLRCSIIILAHTGLRSKELLNLEIDCMEPLGGLEIKVAEEKIKELGGVAPDRNDSCWLSKYKTIKEAKAKWAWGAPILVPKEVHDAVQELIQYGKEARKKLTGTKRSKKLFAHLDVSGGKPNVRTYGSLDEKLKRFIKKFRLPEFTLHQFRHTYATMQYDKGISIEHTSGYLNHKTIGVTAGYTHRTEEDQAKAYAAIIEAEVFSGGGKDKAEKLQKRMVDAFLCPEFRVMTFHQQNELFGLIAESEGAGVHVMDQGICFLPDEAQCPHEYTDVNSCVDEHCKLFSSTETSIPFFADMIRYREESIVRMEQLGFTESVEYNRKKLKKSIRMFEELKEGANEIRKIYR